MKPGDRLIEGEKMVSANGQYQLRGTPDGNFVIEEVRTGRPVYTFPLSNPFGERPAKSLLSYNPDGNICIQSTQNKSYCATDGRDKVAPVILGKSIYLELTDNGRLILVDKDGREIWATTPGSPQPTATNNGLTNLALGKPATQSYNADGKYTPNAGPEKAVDGKIEATLKSDPGNSVAHIQPYKNYQHWEVDLGAVYDIDHIVIWNRQDCCWEELKNFIVTVSPTTIRWRIGLGGKDNVPVGVAQPVADGYGAGLNIGPLSPAWTAESNSFTLKVNRKGRYVCITIPDGSVNTVSLSLAEVQVFGK
ncbi:discoidin domain-containing protein [Persicitalea sp.]|uniref:galactose-binding domain-containing protein n=1 Tax=Persicitalea sp. TaxID=3100273 RepID=UPI003594825D